MKTGCGETSWKEEGTPRGLTLRAWRQSSSDRRRVARKRSSSRPIRAFTRSESTSTGAIFRAINLSSTPHGKPHLLTTVASSVNAADLPAGLNLTGKALTPGAQRSWWLREALAGEPEKASSPLTQDIKADVVIVGGGFTGLWTAYFLTEAKPDLKVVVLEQDMCGGGPSGRNGGFASGWWDELDGMVTLYGP